MCGITGAISAQSNLAPLVEMMNEAICHRGPDDQGVFAEGRVALGHRRLAIIDLSPLGHQPMFSSDKNLALVFNGEIYNFQTIKAELEKEYDFISNSDSEVILAAYKRWGKECVTRFEGMFAFAIYDRNRKEVFICRDRLGIKPLYYYTSDGQFLFASEIRALLLTGKVPRKLNRKVLAEYFSYQTVLAPETMIEGVRMLMPGHCMTVTENGKFQIEQYWSLHSALQDQLSYQQTCDKINELLYKAVEKRLIADVPFGAFLSGGIDSTAIVALMSKIRPGEVDTFSVTFEEQDLNEAKFSSLVAKKFNTRHHEIKLSLDDFLSELPHALSSMDHPSGDGPNTYVVSGATKKAGITMALSGLGGDEIFGGYPVFRRALAGDFKRLSYLPSLLRKPAAALFSASMKGSAAEKISELMKASKVDLRSFLSVNRQVIIATHAKELLSEPAEISSFYSILNSMDIKRDHIYSFVSEAEIRSYMQNVLLRDTDQMSMAHALEIRVPFLDHALVEFMMSVPDSYKAGKYPKQLLVDSMKGMIPEEVWNRKKMGFTLPWKHWMRKDLFAFCDQRIRSLAERDFMNRERLIALWSGFQKDQDVSWAKLWHLIVLEEWLQTNNIK